MNSSLSSGKEWASTVIKNATACRTLQGKTTRKIWNPRTHTEKGIVEWGESRTGHFSLRFPLSCTVATLASYWVWALLESDLFLRCPFVQVSRLNETLKKKILHEIIISHMQKKNFVHHKISFLYSLPKPRVKVVLPQLPTHSSCLPPMIS